MHVLYWWEAWPVSLWKSFLKLNELMLVFLLNYFSVLCNWTICMEHSPWEFIRMLNKSRISPPVMEHNVSLSHLQEPTTGAYPEPDDSNQHPLTLFPQDPF
jgi:hypothetical protein